VQLSSNSRLTFTYHIKRPYPGECSTLWSFLYTVQSPMLYRVFLKRVAPYNFFAYFYFGTFCLKFCDDLLARNYPHTSINFCRFILILQQMSLIFPRVPIVFTLSSFEYSLRKWKCSVPAVSKWGHFLPPCVLVSDNGKQ